LPRADHWIEKASEALVHKGCRPNQGHEKWAVALKLGVFSLKKPRVKCEDAIEWKIPSTLKQAADSGLVNFFGYILLILFQE
jgi:hypothetical protein